jgi:oligopeptide transport system substrate-binding protein
MRRSAVLPLALILVSCVTPDAGTVAPVPPSSEVLAPGSAEGPGTLRVGLGRDPRSIDPRSVVDAEGELIARALFEPLVDVAPDGSLQPASAERWEVEDQGRTYRFHLRATTFHDGRPVTAHDHARALLGVFDLTRPPYFREELLAGLLGARGAPGSEVDGEASGEGGDRPNGADDADPPPDPAAPPAREDGVLRRVWGTPQDIDAAGGVEVVNDRELIVRLSEPDPRFLASLTDVALMPVPYSALGDAAAFAEKPVGNGPFRMLEPRERGTFIRLVAVEDHHRQPSLEGIVFQVVVDDADRSIRLEELLAGRLHVAAVPAAQRSLAGREFGLASPDGWGSGLHAATTASVYAYAFDVSAAPFDDPLLRRAIAAAIDREHIAAVVLAGAADAATTLLPPSLVGVQPICGHCQLDADLARTLFAQWRDGLTDPTESPRLSLTYPRDGGHVAIAESIARDLEATLDVRVFLQARDLGGFGREVASGEAPLFRLGLVAPLAGDAAMSGMLDPTFRSDVGDDRNWTRWGDPASDALLDDLRLGPEGPAAVALATGLAQRLVDEAVVVPLLWTRHDLVVRPEVRGFVLDATGRWWPELVSLD